MGRAQPIQAISIAEERTVEPRSLPLQKPYPSPTPAAMALPPALAHCGAVPARLENHVMGALRVRGGSQPACRGEAGALLGGAAGGSTAVWPLAAAAPGASAGLGLGFPAALQTLPEGLSGSAVDQQGMPAALASWDNAAALGALPVGTLAAPGTPGAKGFEPGNAAGITRAPAGFLAGFQGEAAGAAAGLCGALLQQLPAQVLQGAQLLGAQGAPAGCPLGMGASLSQDACVAAAAAGMPFGQASASASVALGNSAQDAAAALSTTGFVQVPGTSQGLGPNHQPDPGQDPMLARSIRLYGKSRSLPASLPARGGNIWGPPASLPGALSVSAVSSLAGSPLAHSAAGVGAVGGAAEHVFCHTVCSVAFFTIHDSRKRARWRGCFSALLCCLEHLPILSRSQQCTLLRAQAPLPMLHSRRCSVAA